MPLPFSELKVIDLSTVLAGPSVATFFAELGASVLKIENPKNPDVTRSWKLPSERPDDPVSSYFSSVNFQKQYAELDLRNEGDRNLFLDQVKDADILISNFKYGDEEKFAITSKVLEQINPRLIWGKISGFGTESDRVAYDLILQAETGFMSMNGTAESGPVKMPVALIDVLAAHQLKEGILVSLLERSKTGKGNTVSVSLYDAAVCSLANQASNFLMQDFVPQRIGSLHPNIAPYGEIFTTKDKQQITFAIGSNAHFEKLCLLLEIGYISSDERFSNNAERVKNRLELSNILSDRIKEYSSEFINTACLQEFIPMGRIKSLDQVFDESAANQLVREEIIQGKKTLRVSQVAFKKKFDF